MELVMQWVQLHMVRIVFLVVVIVVAVVSTKVLGRLMRKALDRSNVPSASIFINIMRVVIWAVAIGIVLQPVFGISPTTLLTALGVGGVALSLGLKDTVSNVVSGFGLMAGKVIQPGDLVTIGGTSGVVKDITWRQTVVRERSGNEMVIPNSVLNTAMLERLTPSSESCVAVRFVAKGGCDVEAVSKAVIDIVQEAARDLAQSDNPPVVKFTGFSAYGVEGEVWVYAREGAYISAVKDAVTRALAGADFLEQRAAIGQ